MAGVFYGFAAVGFVSLPWLRWFEGDWAEEYYAETYADSYLSGFLGNFETMLTAILVIAIVFAAIAVGCTVAALKLEPRRRAMLPSSSDVD